MELKKEIRFNPAFDKRHKDPSKNYGIHGVDMYFLLKGEHGAVQFMLMTNWMLPHVQKETDSKPPNPKYPYLFHQPIPADLGYHSKKPMYDGHESMLDTCELTGDGPCYYDGSGLEAIKVFDILCEKGSEGVWEMLEEYYIETFLMKEDAYDGTLKTQVED